MTMQFLLISLFLSLVTGCREVVTEGASYERFTGVVHGVVKESTDDATILQLSAGAEITSDISDNTATTDSNGHYSIELPDGTHTLTVSKPGFGITKVFNVVVPGTGTITAPPAIIAKVPVGTFVPDSLSYHKRSLLLGHRVQPAGHLYARHGSIVSMYRSMEEADRDANAQQFIVDGRLDNTDTSIVIYQLVDLTPYGYPSKSDLYLRVRDLNVSIGYDTVGAYLDPIQKKMIYTAVGEPGPSFHFISR